ncbi:MAG: hypothetical protein JWO31_1208 [Phycisphaerales bacterium]|nr:hypothetical protein [Phycisphaerales bacterium]
MGARKQLLAVGGRTLLRRAAEAAVGAACDPVVVVLGCESDRMRPELAGLPVHTVPNPDWASGMGSSIRTGVGRALELAPDAAAAAILLCVQPLVTADTIRRLLAHHATAARSACVSAYAGTLGPPVVVARPLFPELLRLPNAGGAKAVWAGRPDAVAVFPCEQAARDVDTPSDFERLLKDWPGDEKV